MNPSDSENLKDWFLQQGRDLPWRNQPTPYHVWVSEVMLQQTQVAVVIPYFHRWMERFPTIHDLAAAGPEEVIKLWEGLGYYSRARNLHQGAKQVVQMYDGELPSCPKALAAIKGLGPYTIGAIRSFAFRQKAPAVDGNVVRVLARYFGIEEDISKGPTMRTIWSRAEESLPEEEPWIFNEALIELGALICTKKPRCGECPVRSGCLAYRNGNAEELPYKSRRMQAENLYRTVALLNAEGTYLIRRIPEGQIMAGLHEFPYFERNDGESCPEHVLNKMQQMWGINAEYCDEFPKVRHTFTRYRVELTPMRFTLQKREEIEGYQWMPQSDLSKLAYSSGHRRVLQMLVSTSGAPDCAGNSL